jgi:hypothetical protein
LLDFPNSPTNGQQFTGGAGTWQWDGTKWVAVSAPGGPYLPLTGGTLSGPGNLTVSGGQVIGNTMTAQPHALIINDTATVPQAGYAFPGRVTIASETTGGSLILDSYGAANRPVQIMRRARGTAASPAPVLNGDNLGFFTWQANAGAGYNSGTSISASALENWSASAAGSNLAFATVPIGSIVSVNSLVLAGNSATFSGNVAIPPANGLFFSGTQTAAPYINSSTTNGGLSFITGTLNNPFTFFTNTGTTAVSFENTGSLVTRNTSGSWATVSDPRVKTDIAPYQAGLTEIERLEPISFRYNGELGAVNDTPDVTRYGLDASAVEGVMPEMVGRRQNTAPDGTLYDEILTLETGPLIYALVNACKELAARLAVVEGSPAAR